MTDKKWNGTDLQGLTAEYLYDVLTKMEALGATASTVQFGVLGTGARPNYVVAFRDTKIAYNSANHEPDSRADAYDQNNLTERSFTFAEIKQATNGKPKTEERAMKLIYEYYKKEKLLPLTSLQREHAVALVMKGVSVEIAYRTAMESNK
jgi:hypothetical protein